MDHLTAAQRSRLMSRVRSRNTGPEMLIRRGLWSLGLRYRLHAKGLPGTPDLWFPKYECAVFVHGCFWHGHENCSLFRIPKTRSKDWADKIKKNQDRDEKVYLKLMADGCRIAIVWECSIRKDTLATVGMLAEFLRADNPPGSVLEIRAISGTVVSLAQPGRWD